jgi:mannose-1-phosphate guanylyltransferase / mannose-6-phosphate isomerase
VKLTPIILAGGEGSRLYPLSIPEKPKQFINLIGEKSLFQLTCLRLSSTMFESPIIIGQHKHRFLIAQQLEDIGVTAQAIILEPELKNTAPSIAIATLWLKKHSLDKDSMVAIFPSDHYLESEALADIVQQFSDSQQFNANNSLNQLLVLGVKPTYPAIEYGYIKSNIDHRNIIKDVECFIEKPTINTAKQLILDPNVFWNSGMLFAAVDTLDAHFNKLLPDCYQFCQNAINEGCEDLDFYRLNSEAYAQINSISFDYAVLERSQNIKMIVLDSKWDDLGSWQTLSKYWTADKHDNHASGSVSFTASKNCIAHSTSKKLIVDGVEDISVIEGPHTILVTNRAMASGPKLYGPKMHGSMQESEVYIGKRVYRPWGWFEYLSVELNHVVKRIWLKPGGQISLQHHLYRDEHWTVILGTVIALVDEKERVLNEGESSFVKREQLHRLTNESSQPCLVLEVQTGDYLSESDIVRHQDIYSRAY